MDCRVRPHTVWQPVGPLGTRTEYVPPTPREPDETKAKPVVSKPRHRLANVRRLLLDATREKGSITSDDAMELLGLKRNSAGNRLRDLVTEGYLVRESGGTGAPGCRGAVSINYVLGPNA